MTQDNIENGDLVSPIGIPPRHPAEFVAVRIRQKPSGFAQAAKAARQSAVPHDPCSRLRAQNRRNGPSS